MMKTLGRVELVYLLWVYDGKPGATPELPRRLVERGLVEEVAGPIELTWDGAELARLRRPSEAAT